MSKTVDQRVVEMRFDNAQFERGIAQSLQSINNLKESLDFSKLKTTGLDSLSSDISDIGSSVDSIADKFSFFGIAGITAMSKLSSAAIDLGLSIKDNITRNMEVGYDKYNTMMQSIQTIMYGTRDQIGEGLRWATQEDQMDYVTEQIEKLNWYTDETSYNLTDMTNNIGKFVAAGVDLDDATSAMMGISSWAAMSGQNAEAASRAMYNLSQALAIGKVTVADWKSIELANMATTEFKHTVADIAFEMGKLYETEEGWYATLDSKGNEVLVAYDGMRSSLAAGWFDNEVLTAVLKKYGDFAEDLYDSVNKTGLTATELLRYSNMYKEALSDGKDMTKWVSDLAKKENIYNYTEFAECLEKLTSEYNELGRQSFMAGQECKTFKDVMLATEDAATSAWMGIYTAIFGNYLQSKELWSSMAEEFYELFVEGVATKRNILQRWNEIGGRDHLVNALWNVWYNVKDVMNAFTDAFSTLFPEKNAVQLLSYAVAFERLTEALRFSDFREIVPGWTSHLDKLNQFAENVAMAFKHIANALSTIVTAAKNAWERIFPPEPLWVTINRILNGLVKLSGGFEEIVSVFEFTEAQTDKLERSFAGLFAVLDILRMLVVFLLEPFTNIELEIIDIKDPILDVTAAIGDWLVALRDWIRDNNIFAQTLSNIIDFVKKIPGYVNDVLNKLFGIGLIDVFDMISRAAYYVGGAVYTFFTNIPKYAEMATKALFGTDLPTFWENFKGWIKGVWDIALSFFNGIPLKASELANRLFGSGLENFWPNLIQWVLDSKITIFDFFGGLPGKLNLISKLLFHTDLKTFFFNFKDWIKEVGIEGIKTFAKSLPEKINNLAKTLTGSDLTSIWDLIKNKIKGLLPVVTNFFSAVGVNVSGIWAVVKNKIADVWSYVNDFLLSIGIDVGAIWNTVKTKVESLASIISGFFSNTTSNGNSFWDNLKIKIANVGTAIKEFILSIPDRLKSIGVFIKNKLIEIGLAIKEYILSIPDKLKELGGVIKEKLIEIGLAIKDFILSLPEKLKEVWNELKTAFEESEFGKSIQAKIEELTPYFDAFKEKVGNIALAIKTFFLNVENRIKKVIPYIVSFKNKVVEISLIIYNWIIENKDLIVEYWGLFVNKIVEIKDSVVRFFEQLKAKIDEVTPSFEEFKNTVGMVAGAIYLFVTENWDKIKEIAGNIKDFFVSLPQRIDEAGNKLEQSQIGIFFDKVKTTVSGAWNQVTDFFDHLPEKADKATQTLFGMNFIEWWESVKSWCADTGIKIKDFFLDLPENIGKVKDKILELWDALKKLFQEDIPANLDKFSKAVFHKDFAAVCQDVADGLNTAGMALKDFFGIGEEYTQEEHTVELGGPLGALFPEYTYTTGKKSGIQKIKEAIEDVKEWFEETFSSFDSFMSSDLGAWARHIAFLGSAIALGWALYKVLNEGRSLLKAFSSLSNMTENIADATADHQGFWGNFLGGFVNPFKETAEAATDLGKSVKKFVTFKLIADSILEIAGSLALLAAIEPARLLIAASVMVYLFGAVAAVMYLFSGEKSPLKDIDENKADKIGAAFAMIGGTLLEIAAALWIIAQIENPLILIPAVIALGILLGAIMGVLITLDKTNVDKDNVISFAAAMVILGFAIIEIAAALYILGQVNPESLLPSVIALGILLTVISGIMIGLKYAGATIEVMLAFGGAIALIGAGAMMAGAGMWLVADAFEKLSKIGAKGFGSIINGIVSFFDVLPQLATNVGEAIIAFCQVIIDNAETIRETALTIAQVIIAVLEFMVPAIISIIVNGIGQFLEEINSTVDPLMEFLGNLLEKLLNFLLGFVPAITEAILILIDDTLTRLANHIGNITAQLTRILFELILGTIDGITAELPHIMDSVWNFWIALINSFADGIDDHAQELRDALEHLWQSINDGIRTFFGLDSDQPTFLEIAGELISGFINGVTEFAGGAITAIQNFGNDVINGFKFVLGISSPSKVFAEMGRYVDEGFAKGVDDYANVAIASTEDMAQGSIDAMAGAISSVSDMVANNIEADPTIRPVLDLTNVANGIGMMDEMINADRSMYLAATTNDTLSSNVNQQASLYSAFEDLKATLNSFSKNTGRPTQNNNFYITGDDPRAIADEVSRILQQDVEQKGAVWA